MNTDMNISDYDFAHLNAKLEFPVIIADLLARPIDTIPDDVEYALHEFLSDLQPDTALLCMALASAQIANRFHGQSASFQVLDIECERIIEDYALLWLKQQGEEKPGHTEILEQLIDTPDDLEYLADLLAHNSTVLETIDPKCAVLLNIFHIQAEAQAIIADEYVDALSGAKTLQKQCSEDIAEITPELALIGNVIAFPGGARD